jgi:hypothetical protein
LWFHHQPFPFLHNINLCRICEEFWAVLVKRNRRGKTTWGKLAEQLHILNRSVKEAKQDLKLTK